MMQGVHGITKRFLPERGFGFITTQAGDDVFFHISHVERGEEIVSIPDGCWVVFDITICERGSNVGRQQAVNIKFVEE